MQQMSHTCPSTVSARIVVSCAALVAALLAVASVPAQASAANAYGQLCGLYETGNDPYEVDDSSPYGGDVFGAYQMSTGNAAGYASWLQSTYKTSNKTYAAYGATLAAAYKKDNGKNTVNFTKAWKKVFPKDASGYLHTQYLYVKSVYYTPAVTQWQSAVSGFKASSYSYALRNVIFSTAVQHGVLGSASIFKLAMAAQGGYKTSLSETTLINAIYAERSKAESYAVLKARVLKSNAKATVYEITAKNSSSASKYGLVGKTLTHFYSNPANVQVGVYVRLAINEPKSALELYKKYAAATCKHTATTGGKVTKRYSYTDKTHKEKVSKKKCATCGKTLKKAYTRTVKNKFVQSGATWKDAGGHAYTIHAKGWYTVKSKLNVRSKASKNGGVVAVAAKRARVKVSKSKMASDGFWWVKVKVSKKAGWVQARYLAPIGTASGLHKYKKGKCVYSGVTKAQAKCIDGIVAAARAGSVACTFSAAGKSYKSAYKNAKSVKKTYAAGSAVTVVKVCKNRYNDYWGKLAGGGYVNLSLLKR